MGVLHVLAAACYCWGVASLRGRPLDWRTGGPVALGILSQSAALLTVADGQLAFRNYSLLTALAFFVLAALVLNCLLDRRGGFRQAWMALCALAGCASLLALLPLAGRDGQAEGVAANVHLILATLAYALFLLSFIQMIDAVSQARRLAKPGAEAARQGGEMPLLAKEALVFRHITLGFAILTLTIGTGVALALLNGEAIEFDHKNLFAALTWLFCLALLAGRRWRGWRGRIAFKMFLACNVCLVLSYLGTVFVLDVLLA
ncbi:MAG: cytochrome c biogenesis protein CcsA [Betaproteobacteria bacterium AqS2]|uniref:Cytochrome c biogenesis protein CcsA n=1 Tax=Candidatus Amphirhobacter heronislandensis TaxID=1732024 RepID=A0A930UHR6_9GAMM|nr:cytochrome c biogenesis protein CcsA [Betaproteobacteria bacterium AqS2]